MINKKRILVVDPEPAIREIHKRVLESLGYEVETSSDVEGAMRSLLFGTFDMVLTDTFISDPCAADEGDAAVGAAFAQRVKRLNPRISVVFLASILPMRYPEWVDHMIQKPARTADFEELSVYFTVG